MIDWTKDPAVPTIEYGHPRAGDGAGHFTISEQAFGVFHLFFAGRLIETIRSVSGSSGAARSMAEAYLRTPGALDRKAK